MEEGEYRGGGLEGESRGREKRVESEMKEKERVRESIVCLCVCVLGIRPHLPNPPNRADTVYVCVCV